MKLIISMPAVGKTTFMKACGDGQFPVENSDPIKAVDFDYKIRPRVHKTELTHEQQFLHSKLANEYAKNGFEYFLSFNGWFDWNALDPNTVEMLWVIPTEEAYEGVLKQAEERGDSEEFIAEYREGIAQWCADLRKVAEEVGKRMTNSVILDLKPGQFISDVIREHLDGGNAAGATPETPAEPEQVEEVAKPNDEEPPANDPAQV